MEHIIPQAEWDREQWRQAVQTISKDRMLWIGLSEPDQDLIVDALDFYRKRNPSNRNTDAFRLATLIKKVGRGSLRRISSADTSQELPTL